MSIQLDLFPDITYDMSSVFLPPYVYRPQTSRDIPNSLTRAVRIILGQSGLRHDAD